MRSDLGGLHARVSIALCGCAAVALAALAASPGGHRTLPRVATPNLADREPYAVVDVSGPTEVVVQMGGERATVRLIGTYVPNAGAGKTAATRFLERLLTGEHVYVIYEPDWPLHDREGRTWAYVYRAPEGLFVNLELLRQGYARYAAAGPLALRDSMETYERHARRLQKGLWHPDYAKSDAPTPAPDAVATKTDDAPPAEPAAADEVVYATEHGSKYHRKECHHVREGAHALKISDARAAGLTPCRVCNPPG